MSEEWLDKIGNAAIARKQRQDDERAAAEQHHNELRERGAQGARTLDQIVLPIFKQAADRLKQSGMGAETGHSRGAFGTNVVAIGWGAKRRVSDAKRESQQHALRVLVVDGNGNIAAEAAHVGGVWGRIDCPTPVTGKWVEDTLSALIVESMSHE